MFNGVEMFPNTGKKEITHEDFDELLEHILEDKGTAILQIPGIYEILSEYYNNDVLELWESHQ